MKPLMIASSSFTRSVRTILLPSFPMPVLLLAHGFELLPIFLLLLPSWFRTRSTAGVCFIWHKNPFKIALYIERPPEPVLSERAELRLFPLTC